MPVMNRETTVSSIARMGKRRQVVIPKRLCKDLGLREGDLVEVRGTHGAVLIKPRGLVEADDILTPREAKAVARGEAQLSRGECITLAQLHHDLDRPAVQKRRKTA